MKRSRAAFLACGALLVGCDETRPTAVPERTHATPAVGESETTRRIVRVTLPMGYVPSAAIPTLVALHGYRSGPDDFASDPFWQQLADARSIAVVSVSATRAIGPRRFAWTHDVDQDFAHVSAALESVRSSLTIDDGHVMLIGFSQGADVGFRILAAHPGRFRGLVVMSAGALEDAPPLPDGPRDTWRGHGVIVTVGAGEGEYALGYAREIATRARARGARVQDRVVTVQPGHTFPPDLEQVLPLWLATIDPAFAAHD